jgi:hypothetical protein
LRAQYRQLCRLDTKAGFDGFAEVLTIGSHRYGLLCFDVQLTKALVDNAGVAQMAADQHAG